jgi:hypothetical protein
MLKNPSHTAPGLLIMYSVQSTYRKMLRTHSQASPLSTSQPTTVTHGRLESCSCSLGISFFVIAALRKICAH